MLSGRAPSVRSRPRSRKIGQARCDATILGDKDKLLAEIDAVYDGDHAVVATLGPKDQALAEMLSTHEDDLPKP